MFGFVLFYRGAVGLESFVWNVSLVILRLGSLTWDLSFDLLRVETLT